MPVFRKAALLACLSLILATAPVWAASSGNTRVIDSGSYNGLVVGGGSGDPGPADNNSLTVNDGILTGFTYGGISQGSASNNTVIVNGGTLESVASGFGAGIGSIVSNNTLTIQGGSITSTQGIVAAGASAAGARADGNTVTVSGGTISGPVAAANGQGANFTASGNSVAVSGNANITGAVIGGSGSGLASTITGNTVTVRGGTITGSAFGGNGGADNATITGNTVAILGGEVTVGVRGGTVGANTVFNDAYVADNAVIISDGKVGNAYGGYGGPNAAGAVVYNNALTINGGTVNGNAIGGYASRADATATYNTVTVTGGSAINGNVYGGSGGANGLTVSHNTVNLSGGLIRDDVYGGYSGAGGADTGFNTVNLAGGSIGGGVFGGSNSAFITGNTLAVNGFSGSVREINHFERYSFLVPDGFADGSTLIAISGANPTDMSGATVTDFRFAPGTTHYKPGDSVTLISSADAGGTFTPATFTRVHKGPSILYDVLVDVQGSALTASIIGGGRNPQTPSLSQGRVAGMTVVNQGADLISDNGLDRAWVAAAGCRGQAKFATFGAITYSDIETRNDLHANGWSALMGVAWRDNEKCNYGLLIGAFYEAGKGHYHGSDSYGDLATVRYRGDTEYHGGGMLARYRFENNLRVEGSLHMGRLQNNYRSNSYAGIEDMDHDLDSMYYAAFVGAGYDIALGEHFNLDFSAKYFWLHQDDKNADIHGETVHFDSLDSHRLRGGARLNMDMLSPLALYIGGYYEHEFDGQADAHNKTADIDHKPLKERGGTGIGEVGLTLAPTESKNLLFDVSCRGYTGEREGLGGAFSLSWYF